MRKSQSDPGVGAFRLTGFHRQANLSSTLPRIDKSSPTLIEDLITDARANGGRASAIGGPRERAQSERRLLHGISSRAGRRNKDAQEDEEFCELPMLSSVGFKGPNSRARRTAPFGRVTLGGRGEQRVGDFEEDAGSIAQSIAKIRSSLDQFEGVGRVYQPRSTAVNFASTMPNGFRDPAVSQKERLEQYKFSRRMDNDEPTLESLIERLDEDRPPDIEQQSTEIVQRNMSNKVLQNWSPDLRRAQLAEVWKSRALHRDATRERGAQREDSKYQQGVAKISQFDERMQMRKTAIADEHRKTGQKSAQPKEVRERQKQWLVALCMASFLQASTELLSKYGFFVRAYRKKLDDERTTALACPSLGKCAMKIATVVGEEILIKHFTEVALYQMRADWRKRNANEVPEPDEVAMPIPSKDEAAQLLRSCGFIHSSIMTKVKWRRKLRSAAVVHASLEGMRTLRPYAFIMRYVRHVRRIQGFMRWSLQRLAATRARVEVVWERLERKLITEELASQKCRHGPGIARGAIRGGRRARTMAGGGYASMQEDIREGSPAPAMHRGGRRARTVAAEVTLTSEETRTAVLVPFLRDRRYRILPVLDVWRINYAAYKVDVEEWRAARRVFQKDMGASLERGGCMELRMSMPGGAPPLPFIPSHLPNEDELRELIKNTRNGSDELSDGESFKRQHRTRKGGATADEPSNNVDDVVGPLSVPGRVDGESMLPPDLRL